MRASPLFALCCGVLLLTACGIKGPLTLPPASSQQAPATTGNDDINKAEHRPNAPQ